MKTKRTILQSIKKDILKGFKRIYWFSYTILKYHYLTIKFLIINNKITNFKISILLPTRERSKKFERMLNSLLNTCYNTQRIEILLLADEDDNELKNYQEIIKNENYNNITIKLFIKNLGTHAIRNNFLVKKSEGDIIFPINDDMIFVSYNWDRVIDKEFSKINHENPYCIWISSNIKYRYLHCDFPIINKAWYKKLGYVGSEFFNFWYLDTWICDLCFRSGKFIVTPHIKVDQLSANRFDKEIDSTHLKNINTDKGDKDFKIWINTADERKKESLKLL